MIKEDKQRKYFISQPMRGKTEEEIKEKRNQVIEAIKKQEPDAEIIDSYFEDYNPDNGCIPLKYLSKSIELLADADIAYFCEGWENARGCKIECECAVQYGIITLCEEPGVDYITVYNSEEK